MPCVSGTEGVVQSVAVAWMVVHSKEENVQ